MSTIFYFYFNIICHVIYSCNEKAEFQQPLPQFLVSHDPSEILLICSCAA